MTQPPDANEPGQGPDPGDDHPGWGSAPVDPPAAPPPPAYPGPAPTPPTGPSDPFGPAPTSSPFPPAGAPGHGQQPPAYGQYPPPGYVPPGYAPPGYPPAGYPAYGYGPAGPQTSQKAVWSLVTGIVSIVAVCCYIGFVPGIAGIVLGVMARREVKESRGALTGDGLALAGLITGVVGTVLSLAWIVFIIVIAVGGY